MSNLLPSRLREGPGVGCSCVCAGNVSIPQEAFIAALRMGMIGVASFAAKQKDQPLKQNLNRF